MNRCALATASRLWLRLPFLRGFFLGLAFNERDLLDARGIGGAPGRNIGIVFEGVVNKTPFVGIHRLELKRTAGDAHTLRQFPYPLDDAVFAHGAVMFAIDDYLFSILVPGLQQPVKQKLDGLECLAIASDQASALLGINLQRRVAAFIPGFLDLDNETEITEHGIE